MPHTASALGEARLAKEQALARLRQLQTGALEGKILGVATASGSRV